MCKNIEALFGDKKHKFILAVKLQQHLLVKLELNIKKKIHPSKLKFEWTNAVTCGAQIKISKSLVGLQAQKNKNSSQNLRAIFFTCARTRIYVCLRVRVANQPCPAHASSFEWTSCPVWLSDRKSLQKNGASSHWSDFVTSVTAVLNLKRNPYNLHISGSGVFVHGPYFLGQ